MAVLKKTVFFMQNYIAIFWSLKDKKKRNQMNGCVFLYI